jgi:hypothetical protein
MGLAGAAHHHAYEQVPTAAELGGGGIRRWGGWVSCSFLQMPLKNEPFTVTRSTCSDWTPRPYPFSSSQRRSPPIRSMSGTPSRVASFVASAVNVPVVMKRPLSTRPDMAPRKSLTPLKRTLPWYRFTSGSRPAPFVVLLLRGFEKDWAEFVAGAPAGLDGVAVRAERDHLDRVVGTAESQVVHVVDLQYRFAPVGAILDITSATRVLASSAAAEKDGSLLRAVLLIIGELQFVAN